MIKPLTPNGLRDIFKIRVTRLVALLEHNRIRHIFRIIVAMVIALGLHYFFTFTASIWLIIATLFVMLTPTGSALYQGLLRFLLLAAVVIFVSFTSTSNYSLIILMNTIAIGAFIGITINVIFLPDRIDIEFRRALIPILEVYSTYFSGIIELIAQGKHEAADKAKIQVEKCLQKWPSWIYDAGFDIRMQKGHRYFYMKASHLGEILFTLHYLARQTFSEILLENTGELFSQCATKVNSFTLALIKLLELKKLTEGVDDFDEEIASIEKDFKQRIPLTIELLDIKKEYVYFAEFIFTLKDFRNALIKLAKALR